MTTVLEAKKQVLIAHLRKLEHVNRNTMNDDDLNTSRPMVTWAELNELADALRDAAQMLERTLTSTDGQANGSGIVALALVVGFIVAIMGCSFVIDKLAWALGRG